MDCLLLRFDAPLMSFGGVLVDQINPTDRFPGRSMIVGLIGNALGWDHGDTARLARLQARLIHATRWDAEPERLIDYHTVDLGQQFMQDTGWTTRGRREARGGGTASSGTHQRYRHYWANGCATIAIALSTAQAEDPDLAVVEAALRTPARPLFLGRKTCMPAVPILIGRRAAASLLDALKQEPLADVGPRSRPREILACWPLEDGPGIQEVELYDLRDWASNIHRGAQRYATGFLETAP